jgi:hypothetical protein
LLLKKYKSKTRVLTWGNLILVAAKFYIIYFASHSSLNVNPEKIYALGAAHKICNAEKGGRGVVLVLHKGIRVV